MEPCPWCNYNKGCSRSSDCDFRTLPMKEEAIVKRLKKEVSWVNGARLKVVDSHGLDKKTRKMLFDIFDKMKGVDVMAKVLIAKYSFSDSDVQDLIGKSSLSPYQTLKFARKVAEAMR